MSSLINDKNGRKRIQFTDEQGKRQTIRLGQIPSRAAERIQIFVDHLIDARFSKQPLDPETARWVADLGNVLAQRLSNVGLISVRQSVLLVSHIDAYVESRTDLKARTITKFNATKAYLVEFFGSERNLRNIKPGDADEWRIFLINKKMGPNTIRKHVQIAKQFFNAAVRKKLIDANPFAELKSTVQPNPERSYFISRSDAAQVLAACPDAQWKLLFALSRFGGLRCPSEHLALTWDCIDWEQERIRIPSPKTEHHAGRSYRMIPMFPELRPYLEEVYDAAPEGSQFVITRYRSSNTNLRTQLTKILTRAGLKRWPKLFQNLRATRETELAEDFPLHVVCTWLGNTKTVALKHYLQVTDAHFNKATQKATQTVSDRGGPGETEKQQLPQKSGPDAVGHLWSSEKVAATGLEPVTPGL